jgi:hypothetical protein
MQGQNAARAAAPGPRRSSLAVLAAAMLIACSHGDDSYVVGTAHWKDCEVTVESRPAPPRPGHNEVLVILTGARHEPIYDAVVAVRARSSSEWVQAIEDGHVGVYRRAVDFAAGQNATIEVQLRRGNDATVMAFPVAMLGSP